MMENFNVLESFTCRTISKIVIDKDEVGLFTQFLSLLNLFY